MVFDLFSGKGESQIERIEQQIQEMLAACGRTIDIATDALFGRVAPSEVGETLRKSDRAVNRLEREIRRELVVHAGVRGASADIPAILVYMSIVKDIERLGDYAKNLWDVANAGADITGLSEFDRIQRDVAWVRELVDRTAKIFAERDAAAAQEALNEADAKLDEFDAMVIEQLTSDRPSREGVPIALVARYLKRISAHLMNVMTAVVMPLDRLDYWDEDKADRW